MHSAPAMTAPRRPELLPLALFGAWWAITLGWWALAFASVTPATPDWLARTQYVCFGNLANGLPDAYGWTRLILAPTGLLAPLLAVHGRGLGRALRGLWARPVGRIAVALVAVLSLAEGAWVGQRVQAAWAIEAERLAPPGTPQPLPVDYPRQQRAAPAFRLTDQHGQAVSLRDLRGQVVYLTFAFAHCRSTCPLIVRRLVQAAGDAPALGARIVVITLDPWRDTPSALGAAARKWGLAEGGHLLSGTVPQVLGVLARYEMPAERDERTGDISHPGLVWVIDRAGRIVYLLNNPPRDWIVEAGRRAAALD